MGERRKTTINAVTHWKPSQPKGKMFVQQIEANECGHPQHNIRPADSRAKPFHPHTYSHQRSTFPDTKLDFTPHTHMHTRTYTCTHFLPHLHTERKVTPGLIASYTYPLPLNMDYYPICHPRIHHRLTQHHQIHHYWYIP